MKFRLRTKLKRAKELLVPMIKVVYEPFRFFYKYGALALGISYIGNKLAISELRKLHVVNRLTMILILLFKLILLLKRESISFHAVV